MLECAEGPSGVPQSAVHSREDTAQGHDTRESPRRLKDTVPGALIGLQIMPIPTS